MKTIRSELEDMAFTLEGVSRVDKEEWKKSEEKMDVTHPQFHAGYYQAYSLVARRIRQLLKEIDNLPRG